MIERMEHPFEIEDSDTARLIFALIDKVNTLIDRENERTDPFKPEPQEPDAHA